MVGLFLWQVGVNQGNAKLQYGGAFLVASGVLMTVLSLIGLLK